jgi:hypothetical protein
VALFGVCAAAGSLMPPGRLCVASREAQAASANANNNPVTNLKPDITPPKVVDEIIPSSNYTEGEFAMEQSAMHSEFYSKRTNPRSARHRLSGVIFALSR